MSIKPKERDWKKLGLKEEPKDVLIRTGNPQFDTLYPDIKSFMLQDTSQYEEEPGKIVKGYRSPDSPPIWLRDHTHQMKGFKYFEPDMKSAVDFFLRNQMEDGSFYDFVETTTEKGHQAGDTYRVEIEADVEYLAVEAVHGVWQTTGDDERMRWALPKLERGLTYSMTHPDRWSPEHKLVKRAFTIDTWDFQYGDYSASFTENTKFGIMHGDNSGSAKACYLLSKMFAYWGDETKGDHWMNKYNEFRTDLNKVCWNSRFYTHQVHIDPVVVEGVDESEILSLSNSYDLNRGVCDHEQAASIIREYQRRRETVDSFAEWYSIQPPYPVSCFGRADDKYWSKAPDNYVNGGIMPLVGGELAHGAFEEGFEEYGVDILKRYQKMISESGETYLWYHADGSPGVSSPTTLPTDGWGSAAMLYALIEGLAGVVDENKLYQKVRCSPRWTAAGESEATVWMRYESSGAYFGYNYKFSPEENKIYISFAGSGDEANFHVLLPRGSEVKVGDKPIEFGTSQIEDSRYADFSLKMDEDSVVIEL